jgi:hypothetical protein
VAGTHDNERDLWLLLLGALLMNEPLLTQAMERLPLEAAPKELQSLWKELRLRSKDGVATALKEKGVVTNGKPAGESVLRAVAARVLQTYCNGLADKTEIAKRAGDPKALGMWFEDVAFKINAAVAEKEKP